MVSVIPRALASFGGAQEPDPAPRNLIHQARSAPSWLACPPPRLAAILGAQAAAALCSPGTMRPHAAQYGGSPPPHSTGSHPTGAPEALEVCRFWLRQRAWRKTAIHKHDEHSPRRTRRGPRAALPPQKKGRGMAELRLFEPPCKRTSLLGGRNTSVVSYHSPQSRKGPSEFPAGHQGGGSSHGKDCVSSAVHLYTNHRAVACFRRRLEAGLQLTFMYSSTCSRCSFNNASLQFIASHLIAFAVSSILWPLNYVATDWSWGTAALMLALPSCRTKRSCSKAGGGGPRRCRSDGVMRGGMYSWLGDGHAEDGGLEQTREQGRVCRSTKAG